MRVTLLTSIAGIGFSHNRGDVIDVDEAYCLRMIESGQAEVVDEPAKVETATRKTATRKARVR
tara:strand:- start:439 stop:627 length:189 start_codon:yes stop_codon:yes gene_type:complete